VQSYYRLSDSGDGVRARLKVNLGFFDFAGDIAALVYQKPLKIRHSTIDYYLRARIA